MKFSRRTEWPTHTNALTEMRDKKRAAGEAVVDLAESNPTRCAFRFLNPSLVEPLADVAALRYSPDPRGLLSAREAVCAYYRDKKIVIQPEQVFLTASTSESYSFLFRLLCDAHDTVLAPRPSYPLFDYLAALNDVDLERYDLVYEKGWRIGRAELSTAFREKPKALLVVNPNNPTGNFVSADERKFLNALCAAAGSSVIADEVFLDFAWQGMEPESALSLANNKEVLTFVMSGASKILGLPQMKLGWIVVNGPDAARRAAIERLEIIADTYLSVNTPSQLALPVWLAGRQAALDEIRERLRENFKMLCDQVRQNPRLEVIPGEGGWYAVLKVNGSRAGDEALALSLLQKENVFTHPGYFFDFAESEYLVLSLLPPKDVFQEGVRRLALRL